MYSSPWGHDYAWERAVVRKIRDGGAAPLAVSMYDGVSQEHWGKRTGLSTGYVYHDREAAEERALKDKEFREGLREAQEAARAKRAEAAAARTVRAEAERARLAEWEAKEAERAKTRAQLEQETKRWQEEYERSRPGALAERLEHASQERQIMGSKWVCTICQGKSFIERKNPGYQITCTSCGKTAWGSHAALWGVLK